jgi:hypothetical protein
MLFYPAMLPLSRQTLDYTAPSSAACSAARPTGAERGDGRLGAFRMGIRLGAYCLGCCWILMGLLFIGGVMNLLWIAAIAAFVLLERPCRSEWPADGPRARR